MCYLDLCMNYNAIDLLKKDINYLNEIIPIYKQELIDAKEIIKLTNKEIGKANAEHSTWLNYYHEKFNEIKYIREYIQTKVNETHSTIWIALTEKMNIVLSQKDKEIYIKSNTEFLQIYEKYLAIQELYDQYHSLLEAFDRRGYCLNNLTKLIIANTNDWVIT